VKAAPARWAAAAAIASVPWLASAQPLSRQEIENARRYEKRADPVFSVLPPASLQKSVRVEAARSYAVFGYNTPAVRLRLPALDNSAYAVVRFVDAKPVSADGKALPHELEQGLYDPETHATEVRFVSAERKALVPLARAVGRIAIRYPVQVRTTTVRASSPEAQRLGISIDGPYVKYPEKSLGLPDASAISGAEPIRAYDAAGKRLERYDSVQKWELADGVSRKTIAFWGPVASVRFDVVEKWSEVEIPFDVPAAPMRPAGREGIGP
jgi:hypothetical protein